MQWLRRKLAEFFFPPETDAWLTAFRIGLGVTVVVYCLGLRSDWLLLFAAPNQTLISRQLSEAIVASQSPLIPNLAWLVEGAGYLGVSEQTTLLATWLTLLASGCFLIAGFCCRASAITAWLLHLCAVKSGNLLSYGVDNFITIGLFYLMLSPLPDRYAFDRRFDKGLPSDPAMLGLFRRLLQIHLCLIYFFAGLTKSLGIGWWNGANIWRALTRPPFDIIPSEILIRGRLFFPALGIAIWLIELSYPVFIWPCRTRMLWLALVCAMHVAIGLTMGMYQFALIMIVLNVAAFGVRSGRQEAG